MKKSAGILLYRFNQNGIEVLVVHPSGDYNKNAPWSIPKGELDENESTEETARRETLEEIGVAVSNLIDLGFVIYKSKKKQVYGYAAEVSLEIQPRCVSWEIDQAKFVSLSEAENLLHEAQKEFIGRLKAKFQTH